MTTSTGKAILAALRPQLNLSDYRKKHWEGTFEQYLDRFEVELDVEGPQQGVLSFLDSILAMPKLIEIERLRIAIVPTKEQLLRANLVIQKLTPR